MLDAFGGDFLKPVGKGPIQGRAYSNIEAAADKRQPQRLARLLRQLDANAAENTLARFKDDSAGPRMLLEAPPFGSEVRGIRLVERRVMLKAALSGCATVTVQTALSFGRRLGFRKAAWHTA